MREIFHVSEDTKKGTLDLRHREYVPTRNRFFSWIAYNIQFFVLLAVSATVAITVIVVSSTGSAQTTRFYPMSCLGDWNGPSNAQGEPDARDIFSPTKSVISEGDEEGIFCGNFTGESFEGTRPVEAILMFDWYIGHEPRNDDEKVYKYSNTDDSTGESISEEQSTEGTAEIPISETESGTIEASGGSVEKSTLSETEGETEREPESVPEPESIHFPETEARFFRKALARLGARVFAQETSTTTANSEDDQLDNEEDTTSMGELATTSLDAEPALEDLSLGDNGNTMTDGDPDEGSEHATTTDQDLELSEEEEEALTILDTESTGQPKQPEYFSEVTLFEVFYTLDGTSWELLAKITEDNWENSLFPLPIVSWHELSNLQVQIKNVARGRDAVPVYLDALWVEVKYDDGLSTTPMPLSLERLEGLSREPFLIGAVGPDKHFGVKDLVEFTMAVPHLTPELLAQYSATTSTSTDEDELDEENSEEEITLPTPDEVILLPEQQELLNEFGTTTDNILILEPMSVDPESETEDISDPSIQTDEEATSEEPEQNEDNATTTGVFWRYLTWFAEEARAQTTTFAGVPIVISTELMDPRRRVARVPYSVSVNNGNIGLVASRPDHGFRPGRYTLRVEVEQEGVRFISEQSFLWGVLAVNVNKAVYRSGGEAYIQMAALNNGGSTICNAPLQLSVTSPDGDIHTYTTGDGTIVNSPTCGADNVTDHPDYYVRYNISDREGTYTVRLENLDNGHESVDSFTVDNGQSFYIERVGATRINPFKAAYTMELRVHANETFSGDIVERIPSDFLVVGAGGATVDSRKDMTILRWSLQMSPGEDRILRYTYQAPQVSPELYFLGPASVTESGFSLTRLFSLFRGGSKVKYQEGRQWQLASDAVGDIGIWVDQDGSLTAGTAFAKVPFEGSGNEERNDGGYTYNTSTDDVTISTTGNYLVLYYIRYSDTSGNRTNWQSRLTLNGSAVAGSWGYGYVRNANNNEGFIRGAGLLLNITANDEVAVEWRRDGDSGTGGTVAGASSLTIVRLPDDSGAAYGHYGTPAASGFTGQTWTDATGWDAIRETDTSAIELQAGGSDIRLKNANKTFLIIYGLPFDGQTTNGDRTQRIGRAVSGSTEIEQSNSYTYLRDQDTEYGSLYSMFLYRTTIANEDLSIQAQRGNAIIDGVTPAMMNASGEAGVFVVELPDTAEAFISVDGTGSQDVSSSGLLADLNLMRSVDYNDSSSFTKEGAGHETMRVEQDMDMLVTASCRTERTQTTNVRLNVGSRFEIEGIDQTRGRHGTYVRGAQGNDDTMNGSFNPAGVFTAVTNDSVQLEVFDAGDDGLDDATVGGSCGFGALNLDSIIPVVNSVPTISNHSLNVGSNISLVESTFKWASSTMTITDLDGCDEIATTTGGASVSAIAYYSSTTNNGTTCLQDDNICYPAVSCVATSTNICTPGGGDTMVDYECGFKFWYIANPTDTSSPFTGDIWTVAATTTDKFYATSTATNTGETVDVNSLLALDIISGSINYGTISGGSDSGSDNEIATTTNTGNRSIDVDLGGDDMKKGLDTISPDKQKFSTTTFTYSSGGTLLTPTTSPIGVVLDLPKPTATTTTIEDEIYWGIRIPVGQATGVYTGTTIFTAVANGAGSSGTSSLAFDYLFSDGTDIFWSAISTTSTHKIDDAGNPGGLSGMGRQIVRTSGDNLYVFINDGGSCEMWKSSDGGSSWLERHAGGNPACNSTELDVAMAIDSADTIHTIYIDDSDTRIVRYITFNTGSDTFGSEELALTLSDGGSSNDISIDSNDVPHVVILDDGVSDSIVYTNRVGGSWGAGVTLETVTTLAFPSITLSEDDVSEIAYLNNTDLDLTYALGYNNDPGSGEFDLVDVDTEARPSGSGGGASIGVDSSGNTWIGYIDDTTNVTLVERLDASATSTWESSVTDSDVGEKPSIAIDGTDVYIFYEDESSNIAYNKYDGSWAGETILEDTASLYQDAKVKWSFNNNN